MIFHEIFILLPKKSRELKELRKDLGIVSLFPGSLLASKS